MCNIDKTKITMQVTGTILFKKKKGLKRKQSTLNKSNNFPLKKKKVIIQVKLLKLPWVPAKKNY